ncbi:MAG: oligosaccharide flippase family protein, partial [Aliifodinibius sp.]|nr:oligosaccharide flippase family protein [Fodinibius sp.]NIV12422.1 oligosaccharide flippase family protein [Fodinibius sp.]NIY26086.1 oligosaccharide flippase family protein [Fodinibius sp.]
GWKPRLQFSWADIQEISRFSGSVFGTRILNFLNLNALHVLINKFFGSVALGLFSLVYQVIDLPTQRIAKTIMKVMYPILSKLQHKPKDYES